MRRVHLLVKGRVQGVSYRFSAYEEATRRKLRGFVRNLDSGEVEAVAEGEPSEVDDFIAWCRRGPTHARVDHVEVTDASPSEGELGAFRVEYGRE